MIDLRFQDLDVTNQLDFGIRFFDFDIIYSNSAPFCSGLETGHGKYPGIGIYQVREGEGPAVVPPLICTCTVYLQ